MAKLHPEHRRSLILSEVEGYGVPPVPRPSRMLGVRGSIKSRPPLSLNETGGLRPHRPDVPPLFGAMATVCPAALFRDGSRDQVAGRLLALRPNPASPSRHKPITPQR